MANIHFSDEDVSMGDSGVQTIPLTYFLETISLVPHPVSEEWVMTTEQTMMMERALLYLEFSSTGGHGKEHAVARVRIITDNIYQLRAVAPHCYQRERGYWTIEHIEDDVRGNHSTGAGLQWAEMLCKANKRYWTLVSVSSLCSLSLFSKPSSSS